MPSKPSEKLSRIPSVDKVKRTPKVSNLLERLSDEFVTDVVREVLGEIRSSRGKTKKEAPPVTMGEIENEVADRACSRRGGPAGDAKVNAS